jgi:hypothetical protein
MTEAEFNEDLAAGPLKDLARVAKHWPLYEVQVAAPLREVAAEAACAGVTVRPRAGLCDIWELCERFKVLTIIGHWKYLLIDAADIVNVDGFHRLLDEALERKATVGQAGRDLHVMFGDDPGLRKARTAAELAAALSAHLHAGMEYHYFAEEIDGAPPPEFRPKSGPTRTVVEREYPGCFVEGRSLELGDGLCAVDNFTNAIPESYDGLLDLTNCFSLILAEAVRARRALCNAICMRGMGNPGVRFTMYRHIIKELSRLRQPYERAAKRVHLALIDEIRRRLEEPFCPSKQA